jgi:GH43 family beta-xylosidase
MITMHGYTNPNYSCLRAGYTHEAIVHLSRAEQNWGAKVYLPQVSCSVKELMIKVLLTAAVANTDVVFRIKAVNKGRNSNLRDTNNISQYPSTDPVSGDSFPSTDTLLCSTADLISNI